MPQVTDVTSLAEAQPPYFLGIDVGGTGIKFGVVDDEGRTLGRTKIETHQERGPEDACQRMQASGRELVEACGLSMEAIEHVGLATPGTMDVVRGLLLQPHNLRAWWDFPIRDHLRGILSKPVAFINDANAAAYGEYWIGGGAEYRSMVFFTLGTGIGSGIIVDGILITGEHSHGSECGHTIIDSGPDARACGCGRPGHLEAYASAKAVIKRTQEALDSGRRSSLSSRLKGGEELSPLMVAQEAEKDDPLAVEIVMETADYLSCGAVNAMHVIDPNAVIFGGAMNFGGAHTDLGRRFLERIRSAVRDRVFPSLVGKTHIDFALLGGHAGYIGAVAAARSEYQAR